MFFSVVAFIVVGMCSYDETLCGFLWVRVDSDHSFPATWSLRWSVFCSSVCLWSFLMERQLQDAEQKHCQRRFVGRPVRRCSDRQWSHLSAYDEQARRENVKASRPVSNRCARRCPECCLYQGWTLFGSAHSFVLSRDRPTRRHTTTIECVWGRR